MAQGVINPGKMVCYGVCGLNILGASKIYGFFSNHFQENDEMVDEFFQKFRRQPCTKPEINNCQSLLDKFEFPDYENRDVKTFLLYVNEYFRQNLKLSARSEFDLAIKTSAFYTEKCSSCGVGECRIQEGFEVGELDLDALKRTVGNAPDFKITPDLLYETLITPTLPFSKTIKCYADKDCENLRTQTLERGSLHLAPFFAIDIPVGEWDAQGDWTRWRHFCKHEIEMEFTNYAPPYNILLTQNSKFSLIAEVLYLSNANVKGDGTNAHVVVNVKQYNGHTWYHVNDKICKEIPEPTLGDPHKIGQLFGARSKHVKLAYKSPILLVYELKDWTEPNIQ